MLKIIGSITLTALALAVTATPGFLVPLYLLTHLMVFARLAGRARHASGGRAVSTS